MKLKKAKLYMDTVIDIQVVSENREQAEAKMNLAFEAFRQVEHACSRFTADSELMQASQIIGEPVEISPYLFQPLRFALEMAEWTKGVFDPTVGKTMEELGFNRHYLTKERMHSQANGTASYKDIILDEQAHTVLFKKQMVIDLGAVAKGFAIDLAANELREFPGFIVNAGGDIFVGGHDADGGKWKIGIQHPVLKDEQIDSVELTNMAICTSGSYERKQKDSKDQHHIIHPKTKQSPNRWVSCSVIAPFAMMADAFSTVAFLLEPAKGREMIGNMGIQCIFINPELQMVRVGGI